MCYALCEVRSSITTPCNEEMFWCTTFKTHNRAIAKQQRKKKTSKRKKSSNIEFIELYAVCIVQENGNTASATEFHYIEFYKWIFNQNCLFTLVVLFSIVFLCCLPLFLPCVSFYWLFVCFFLYLPHFFFLGLIVVVVVIVFILQLIHSARSIWFVFQFYCAFSPHIVIRFSVKM